MMKLLFTYRGLRVRKFYQNIKVVTFLAMLLPFFILVGLYVWFHQLEIFSNPVFYGLLFSSLLLCLIVFDLMIQRIIYQKTLFFSRLNNLRILATFLIENNYYSTKKTENGDRIRLPRVYLSQTKFGAKVTFILQGNKFQDRFQNLGGTLETMFDGDFMSKVYSKGFVTYEIAVDQFSGRLNVGDVKVTPKGLQLMKDVYWNYDEQPHLLGSGGTGGGKTVFLMSIIGALAKVGHIDIGDPKKSDFVALKDIPVFHGRVFFEKEDMIQCLKDNVDFMNARYLEMTSHPQFEAGKRYSAYGMKPKFIIFDEWAAFMSSLQNDYKSEALVMEYLTQIVLKGRQAGVFMLLFLQRPDGEYIKTALRDNFMKRVSIGHLEDTGYMMMYGDANRTKEFKKIDVINGKKVYGRGYIANGGEIAREFYSPYVPFDQGYSFIKEFAKLPVLPFEGREYAVFEQAERSSVELPISEEKELGFIYPDMEEVTDDAMYEIKDIARMLDKTFGQVNNVAKLVESSSLKEFSRNDSGKLSFDEQDYALFESIFEKKEESDLSYQQIIDEMKG